MFGLYITVTVNLNMFECVLFSTFCNVQLFLGASCCVDYHKGITKPTTEEESIKVQGKWLLCSEQKKKKTSEILVFDENNLCVCV